MEDYDKALYYIKKALDIDLKIFGNDHLKIATRNHNVAHCYYSIGEPSEGLPYIIKAYKIRYRILGHDHPLTKKSWVGIQAHGGSPDVVKAEVIAEIEDEKHKLTE